MKHSLSGAILISMGTFIQFAWEYCTRFLFYYRLKEFKGVEGEIQDQLPEYLFTIGKFLFVLGLILIMVDIIDMFKKSKSQRNDNSN